MGRILAVDPGEKNIGLAISDPNELFASSLCVLRHTNRADDARRIAVAAAEQGAERIIVGQPLDSEGEIGEAARHSQKVIAAIQKEFPGEVIPWDESGSTDAVQDLYVQLGVSRRKRRGHHDARAAAWILQDYLNWLADQKRIEQLRNG